MADVVNGWTDEGVFEGGASFGDYQVADDVTRRYVKPLRDGTWAVVTEAYAVSEQANCPETPGGDHDWITSFAGYTYCQWCEAEPRYYVDERADYLTCSDPSDPGSTELDADYEYGEGSYLFYHSIERAQDEARRLASVDNRPHLFWHDDDVKEA